MAKFADYSGEIIPLEATPSTAPAISKVTGKPVGQEVDDFAKAEKDRLAQEKIQQEAKSFGLPDWMVVPLITAAVGTVGTLAAKKYLGKNPPETPPPPPPPPPPPSNGPTPIVNRVEPTLAPAPTAPAAPTVAPQTSRTLEESAALANSLKPPPTPVQTAESMLGKDAPSAINRAIPPRTGLQDFGMNTPPGSYSSPAAPMGIPPVLPAPPSLDQLAVQHVETAVAPTLAPQIADVAAAPTPPTEEKKTRLRGEDKNIRDAEIARIANNPTEIADKPGMRANYVKPVVPPLNPETGKSWMGSSGYNYLASQIGHEAAPEAWKALYGEQNVPFKKVQADYAEARKLAGVAPKTKGGAFGTPNEIPSFIKGKATPGMLGILGLGAAMSQLTNAKNLPEAALRGIDIATDYIPGITQFKQGMSPTELGAKEAEDLAFQRRMEAASKKGAGNRGAAYDPRKFYTPMDTGNPMFNIGVPPPR